MWRVSRKSAAAGRMGLHNGIHEFTAGHRPLEHTALAAFPLARSSCQWESSQRCVFERTMSGREFMNSIVKSHPPGGGGLVRNPPHLVNGMARMTTTPRVE